LAEEVANSPDRSFWCFGPRVGAVKDADGAIQRDRDPAPRSLADDGPHRTKKRFDIGPPDIGSGGRLENRCERSAVSRVHGLW